jgi:hypothetical protein
MHRRRSFDLRSSGGVAGAPCDGHRAAGGGGNTDMMARLAAQHLTEKLGQSFVSSTTAPAQAAQPRLSRRRAARWDTMLFTPASMLLLTPLLQKLSFDPDKQLLPVTNVGTGAQVIAIKRELPAHTLPEFLAYAKANPGKLNFAVAGTQNISHLAPVLLFARAGVNLVMVPAKGEAQAISDLIAGQVDFYFGNASQLLPHADTERIRLLAGGGLRSVPPDEARNRALLTNLAPSRPISRTSRLIRQRQISPSPRSPTQCQCASRVNRTGGPHASITSRE